MILFRRRANKWILLFCLISCVCFLYTAMTLHIREDISESNVHSNNIPVDISQTMHTNKRLIADEVKPSEKNIKPTEENGNGLNINRTNNLVSERPVVKRSKEPDHGKQNRPIDNNLNRANGHMNKTDHKITKVKETVRESKETRVLSKHIVEPHNENSPKNVYTQRIAIVALVCNAEGLLQTFGEQLIKLNYPHHLISVFFGESGSTDNTFKKAANLTSNLMKYHNFSKSAVTDLQMSGGVSGNKDFRHRYEFQMYRRSYLAHARNRIVRHAMQAQHIDHIITIDSDIIEFPTDLVQQMLDAHSDVVATSCMIIHGGNKYMYDFNSWRETVDSLEYQASIPLDALVMEGYSATTKRIFLPYIRQEGRVVKLDGVGGCTLMIKADCFRSGLIFPDFLYKRHIETEGLAKMARDMGFSVVGLPFLEVFHHSGD